MALSGGCGAAGSAITGGVVCILSSALNTGVTDLDEVRLAGEAEVGGGARGGMLSATSRC